ncbi:MAG: hypothetical protein ABIP93_06475, partial [Gemmatimonadaceae bacterium]
MKCPLRACNLAAQLLSALSLLSACTDRVTEPRTLGALAPSFAIFDAAQGGNSGFYFLPPLVPAPSYTGIFDGTKAPVVTICVLAGGTCATSVATFSGSQVKLDLEAQSYGVNWKTKDAGLDPTKMYRIQVALGATVLGYADVMLNNGGTLPIRFRIEAGAPPPPPPAGTWKSGDFVTYNQDAWGTLGTTASAGLIADFFTVYSNGVEIGLVGAAGNSAIFNTPEAILDFLPMSGTPGSLDRDLQDPNSST